MLGKLRNLIPDIQIPICPELDLLRKEHHDQDSCDDKGPKSNLAFPGFFLKPDENETRDRSDHIGKKESKKNLRPANDGSRQKAKFHVPSPDPFSARHPNEKEKEKRGYDCGEKRDRKRML